MRILAFPHFSWQAMRLPYSTQASFERSNLVDEILKEVYNLGHNPWDQYNQNCKVDVHWQNTLPLLYPYLYPLYPNQKRALEIILPDQSYHESHQLIHLLKEESHCARVFTRKFSCDTSSKLFELLPKPINHEHNLRHARNIPPFKSHTKRFSDSCLPYCVGKWDTF